MIPVKSLVAFNALFRMGKDALTVTVAAEEKAVGQVTLCTMVRYCDVCVRLFNTSVFEVFGISVIPETKLSVEACHLITLPVFPPSVKVAEFCPEVTVVPPDIVPPTVFGYAVATTGTRSAVPHPLEAT